MTKNSPAVNQPFPGNLLGGDNGEGVPVYSIIVVQLLWIKQLLPFSILICVFHDISSFMFFWSLARIYHIAQPEFAGRLPFTRCLCLLVCVV